MRGRYVTAERLDRVERTLSPRDRAILDSLDRLRVATTVQLRRLHFADLTTASAARQAPRTLRRLEGLKLVACLERQLGGARAGSAAAIWSLDRAGQRLASAAGPAGGLRTRRPWTPGLPFLAHRLSITECAVSLTEAARAGRCELLDYEAEPLSWRRYAAPYGGWAQLKPDAFARLAVGDYERGAFVEIDRATEAGSTISRKLAAFRRYWQAGREQTRRGYFPLVVFSVPNEARKATLVDLVGRQPADTWPLYRIVLAPDLTGACSARRPDEVPTAQHRPRRRRREGPGRTAARVGGLRGHQSSLLSAPRLRGGSAGTRRGGPCRRVGGAAPSCLRPARRSPQAHRLGVGQSGPGTRVMGRRARACWPRPSGCCSPCWPTAGSAARR